MVYLEKLDNQDRLDGTPRMERLRQIPPETGKFLSILAASAPKGEFLEIGTSAGYSTLWIALACQLKGNKLITFEILEEKAQVARETIELTKLQDIIELVEGDARDYINKYKKISFCFLDAEKEVYEECYDLILTYRRPWSPRGRRGYRAKRLRMRLPHLERRPRRVDLPEPSKGRP